MHDKNSTTTAALVLRQRWTETHHTSVPTYTDATSLVTRFEADDIIRALSEVMSRGVTHDGDVVRAMVKGRLIRAEGDRS